MHVRLLCGQFASASTIPNVGDSFPCFSMIYAHARGSHLGTSVPTHPNLAYNCQQALSSCWDGRPFGQNKQGPKVGRGWRLGLGPHWVPIQHNLSWDEAYLLTK